MSTAQSPATAEAGTHLIADFWGVETIDSVAELERVVRAAVEVAGATLLELAFHQFPGHGGITGYAMLAESHVSVHTWPERDYVAIDVFMCGEQRPEDSLEVLRRAFRPTSEGIRSVRRGVPTDASGTPDASDISSASGLSPASGVRARVPEAVRDVIVPKAVERPAAVAPRDSRGGNPT